MSWILSAIVFLPLAGALAAAMLPKESGGAAKWLAAVVAGVDLVLVAVLVAVFDVGKGMQFVTDVVWVPQAHIRYHLAVDGISITMLALSALLSFVAVLASWKVESKPSTYFAMLLLLEVGMNGVFVALDFVLFYVFWELVLVPMYFLISMWGGPRREYASLKFFLYTLFGSVFMLVGIVALFLIKGTFDITQLASAAPALLPHQQWWLFLAFFLGFAVKVPVWPLHTWLPDAHVEAPTAGSVLLAGVLLKMGTYGFIRIALPILPDAVTKGAGTLPPWQPILVVLATISIVYGAAVAFAQTDLKKLVAYSSVSHMGFVMLGIASLTPEGINGAVAVMFSHGLVTGLLFLMVGMVYERGHTRKIEDLSGLMPQVPRIGAVFALASFASLGLPGMSGFVGEFLSLLGGWQAATAKGALFSPVWVVVSAVGVLLAAAYMLWMVQRVVLGNPSRVVGAMDDMTGRELATVLPLVALTFVVGIYWSSLLRFVDPAVRALLAPFGGA
ncbi:MAG TPA: NADH-quinone oxidoreductase subunit M [Coriobacteriia bacterium]